MKKLNYEDIRDKERFLTYEADQSVLKEAMEFSVSKVHGLVDEFGVENFPDSKVENNKYSPCKNINGWTTGFWTGMVWLAYEWSNEEKLKEVAMAHLDNFNDRLDKRVKLNHHDIGFLYSITSVAGYKILGDKNARVTGIKAADLLMERFIEKVGIIDRGPVRAFPENYCQFIIDCSMNVPLLFWAYEETGDKRYYNTAVTHMKNAVKYALRDDGSTFQEVTFDRFTGELLMQTLNQGYRTDANWARGQAWGIYGLALCYKYTKNKEFLTLSKCMANFYLNRLPEDDICGWDLVFRDNDCQRDTSAATPAICGLLELATHLPITDLDRMVYEKASLKMLQTLHHHYTSKKVEDSNGILLHGVYSFNRLTNIDDLCIWGDYYYMEALTRALTTWNCYW